MAKKEDKKACDFIDACEHFGFVESEMPGGVVIVIPRPRDFCEEDYEDFQIPHSMIRGLYDGIVEYFNSIAGSFYRQAPHDALWKIMIYRTGKWRLHCSWRESPPTVKERPHKELSWKDHPAIAPRRSYMRPINSQASNLFKGGDGR